MLISTVFFGLMAVTIRYASRTLPTFEIAFFRNAFGLLALLPLLLHSGASLRTKQLPRYLLRSAIGICSMLSGFWAIGHLPLSQAISLSYSTPLFVTILAVFWLGEHVRKRRWAAVLSAIVAIQIKQLSRIDPADTIVFYTYVFWVPLSLVPALFVWQWPHGMEWGWLLLTGAFGTGGQLLWTRALRLGDVSALQPISFMQLPLVATAGYLLFGESIDRWTVIGATVILAANAYIAHREARLARQHATTAPVEAAKPGE
jgi:drug/metabolite transporter (DMT)-like permease